MVKAADIRLGRYWLAATDSLAKGIYIVVLAMLLAAHLTSYGYLSKDSVYTEKSVETSWTMETSGKTT